MKILFAIKTLNHSHGGAERVLTDISGALAGRGHDVTILTFDPPGERSFYPLSEKVRRLDLAIGNVERPSQVLEILTRIKAMRKAVKSENPEIVVAFMHSTFIPASVGLLGCGIPLIASEHIVPDHYRTRLMEYALFLAASFFIKKITVVTENVLKTYHPLLRRKMEVMPNPIRLPSGNKAATSREKLILNVGRLDPQKDQETLIRAFARLAPHFPQWNLRIVGEGNLRIHLENLVMELNLKDRIALPGLSQNIDGEYERAEIFVMSSLYESFGLATAEAMAHGLPVIGYTNCPGTNEIIKDGINGFLIDPKDRVSSLEAALIALIKNEKIRRKLGEGGRESLRTYTLENVTTLWENLLLKNLK
ncbi:MAG: glycosyltransferase family 4 protein [Alphaproteobacteria bacterium]|nr:glycosyltransferase family 4 protein [Alphaproteobacteria bacterium]